MRYFNSMLQHPFRVRGPIVRRLFAGSSVKATGSKEAKTKELQQYKEELKIVKVLQNLLNELMSKSQKEAITKAARNQSHLTTITFSDQNPGLSSWDRSWQSQWNQFWRKVSIRYLHFNGRICGSCSCSRMSSGTSSCACNV